MLTPTLAVICEGVNCWRLQEVARARQSPSEPDWLVRPGWLGWQLETVGPVSRGITWEQAGESRDGADSAVLLAPAVGRPSGRR